MAQRLRTCLKCRRWRRLRFNLWVRKIPWRRGWPPTPVFLPEKSHGQRSLFLTHVCFEWCDLCVSVSVCVCVCLCVSVCVCVCVSHLYQGFILCLILIDPKGNYTSLNRNATPFTIQRGFCFLFAYGTETCTQNSSQSNSEGEEEMQKQNRGVKKKKARFEAFVASHDANNVQKRGAELILHAEAPTL